MMGMAAAPGPPGPVQETGTPRKQREVKEAGEGKQQKRHCPSGCRYLGPGAGRRRGGGRGRGAAGGGAGAWGSPSNALAGGPGARPPPAPPPSPRTWGVRLPPRPPPLPPRRRRRPTRRAPPPPPNCVAGPRDPLPGPHLPPRPSGQTSPGPPATPGVPHSRCSFSSVPCHVSTPYTALKIQSTWSGSVAQIPQPKTIQPVPTWGTLNVPNWSTDLGCPTNCQPKLFCTNLDPKRNQTV